MLAPPTPARPAPGLLIAGKYRLLRPVGEGAMGAVWAARNEVTSAEVALKLVQRPDPEMRQRIQREARVGAILKHHHILDVYDAGDTESGDPYLVMQLLHGETLAALLQRKRRLDAPEAARIARDVARALAAAHTMQVVHRDLKPANVFLHRQPGEDEPLVKVLDFGVAKDLTSSDSLRTVAGTVIGSLYYMSPEQANARTDIDPRADIWSLGVVLFELVTGQRPFQGDGPQVLAAILRAEIPRASRYVRHLDSALDELIARCMRRDRDERPASAADLAKELHRFAEPPTPVSAPRAQLSSAPDGTLVLPRRDTPAPPPAPTTAPLAISGGSDEPPVRAAAQEGPVVHPRGGTVRIENVSSVVGMSALPDVRPDLPQSKPAVFEVQAEARPRRSRAPIVIGLLALVGAGGVAAVLALPGNAPQDEPEIAPATPTESTAAAADMPTAEAASAAVPESAPPSAPAPASATASASASATAPALAPTSAPRPSPASAPNPSPARPSKKPPSLSGDVIRDAPF